MGINISAVVQALQDPGAGLSVAVVGAAYVKTQSGYTPPVSFYPDPLGNVNRFIRVDWAAPPTAGDVATAGTIIAALDIRKRRPRGANNLYQDIRNLTNAEQTKVWQATVAYLMARDSEITKYVNKKINPSVISPDEIDPDG
jgi:hypothetical protein